MTAPIDGQCALLSHDDFRDVLSRVKNKTRSPAHPRARCADYKNARICRMELDSGQRCNGSGLSGNSPSTARDR